MGANIYNITGEHRNKVYNLQKLFINQHKS